MPELVLPRGLILPDRPDGMSQTNLGILVPHSAGSRFHGLLTARQEGDQSLVVPTDAELLQFVSSGNSTKGEKRKGRSSTEFALALHQPHRFIAREAEKQLSTRHTSGIENVLSVLRSQGAETRYDEEFDSSVLERKKSSRRVTNLATGEEEIIETSSPGALEQVGIAITSLLDDSEIAASADTIILAPLSKLLREFRIHSGHRQELPEMPDLTQALLDNLGKFSGNRRVRYSIYGILEQIHIPLTMQEEIAERMDKIRDLEHPLAFQVTRDLAERKPHSQWIVTQQKRREHLLAQLQGSNQELFEQFDELLDLSRGLVYHDDPLNTREGKVGIEVELRINNLIREKAQLEGHYDSETEASHETGLDRDQWTMGRDGFSEEIRKASGYPSLEHNSQYLSSLTHLYKWFGDYADHIVSMHLHFDRDRHPHLPSLGHLLDGETRGRGDSNSTVAASWKHPTYEIRGIFPPRADGNIHPARIEDVIGLYLSATQNDTQKASGKKLHLSEDQKPSVKKLTWGHITTFLDDPQGRLAALMVLHDTVALANVNPLAFAISFDKGSLSTLIDAIQDKFRAPTDRDMLEGLKIFATEEEWLTLLRQFPKFNLMRTILGVQDSDIVPASPISNYHNDPLVSSLAHLGSSERNLNQRRPRMADNLLIHFMSSDEFRRVYRVTPRDEIIYRNESHWERESRSSENNFENLNPTIIERNLAEYEIYSSFYEGEFQRDRTPSVIYSNTDELYYDNLTTIRNYRGV